MRAKFQSSGIFLERKISMMREQMECPTVSHNFWKKMGRKPSGPGAFMGLKEKIAFFIRQL